MPPAYDDDLAHRSAARVYDKLSRGSSRSSMAPLSAYWSAVVAGRGVGGASALPTAPDAPFDANRGDGSADGLRRRRRHARTQPRAAGLTQPIHSAVMNIICAATEFASCG